MIVVTGATGYVGKFLLDALSRYDEPVRCLVRPKRHIKFVEKLRARGVEIALGELEDTEFCRSIFSVCRT